jgi:hypothetical protein
LLIPARNAVFAPEEMDMTVNHQAGTLESDPPAPLMLPSMASTMAVSKVDPVPESRVARTGVGSATVALGWYDRLIECSDVTGKVAKHTENTNNAVMSWVPMRSITPKTPTFSAPCSLASRQALNTINMKGITTNPVPVMISPKMLAKAQPYIVVKISR